MLEKSMAFGSKCLIESRCSIDDKNTHKSQTHEKKNDKNIQNYHEIVRRSHLCYVLDPTELNIMLHEVQHYVCMPSLSFD
jgi:hypothetical protein